MIDPQDVVALLNALDRPNQTMASVAIDHLRELVHVWLRVAAKHEEVALRPHLYAPEVRELVEVMLLGAPAVVSRGELAAAARIVAEEAGHPFIVCHCGEEFLPGQPHCPACGELVQ